MNREKTIEYVHCTNLSSGILLTTGQYRQGLFIN